MRIGLLLIWLMLLPLNTYTIVSAYGRGDVFWITIGFVAMCVSVFGLKRSIDHVRDRWGNRSKKKRGNY